MYYLIPIGYTAAGIFIFYKWKQVQCRQLSGRFIALAFIIKSVLSAAYIYMHYRLYGGADTANYFDDSMIIYRTLFENPLKYLLLTFGPNHFFPEPSLIASEIEAMGYWHDSSSYSVVRFYAISNLLSGGNIYAAGVFMAFITTAALSILYRVAMTISQNELLNKIIIFGIPSVLFWTSGVHKEGLMITGLSIFFYTLTSITEKKQAGIARLLLLAFSGWLIWYVRDYTFYLMLPGCLAYLICTYTQTKKTIIIFLSVYLTIAAAVLPMRFQLKNERLNIWQAIERKQQQFQHSQRGNTDIMITPVKPTVLGVFSNIPSAFIRTLTVGCIIKPTRLFHWFFWLENIVILLLIVALIYKIHLKGIEVSPLAIWLLLFAITLMILTGLVVANGGAMIRYRSIMWPFLLTGITGLIKNK